MADTCQEHGLGGIGLVRHTQSLLQLLQLFPLLLVLLGNITLDNKNRSTAAIQITGLYSLSGIFVLRSFPQIKGKIKHFLLFMVVQIGCYGIQI